MQSRREFVRGLAAGATGAAVVLAGGGIARAKQSKTAGTPETAGRAEEAVSAAQAAPPSGPIGVTDAGTPATTTAPPPWDLLRPLKAGAKVTRDWKVADLTGIVDGTCVLTLQNRRGRMHRIHLCRNDGRPQGLVYTDRVDLVVMNGGQGDLPTDETLAQAVAQVAHVLASNEARQAGLVTALLPHAERLRMFSGTADRRLR